MTDANLVLGYLSPKAIGGGRISLSIDAAREAIRSRIAEPLGMTVEEAASGIFRISNGAMTNAIRYVSISRGRDPRDFALMAYGGAGPVHVGVQAKDLGVKTILVPKNAGVFSALGCLISNFKIFKVKSFIARESDVDLDELNAVFHELESEGESLLDGTTGIVEKQVQRFMDIRYVGQTHEVTVPIRSRTKRVTDLNFKKTIQDFHELHEQLYSFKRPNETIEVMGLRADIVGVRDTMKYRSLPFASEDPSKALTEKRQVNFEGRGFIETNIYHGKLVEPGNLISGPAVIEEPETTIVIYPGQEAMLDHYQTYVIESLD